MLDLRLPDLITRLVTLVIAFTVHEFAHAWTATQLGDSTPRSQGRLTLNPLVHLDPFGSLILMVTGFGWAKPVAFQPYNLRYGPRTGTALVAAAGPLSNLVLALLASIPFQLGVLSTSSILSAGRFLPTPASFLGEFILINLLLLFFNLIPLPPLDGHKVATGVFPGPIADFFYRLQPIGPLLLMLLLFITPMWGLDVIGPLVRTPTQVLFRILIG